MYDKYGVVLPMETTSNDVRNFRHYRKVVHRGGVGSPMKVAPVLKNIYSLNIMASLLRAANRRYEAFLCALEQPSVDLRHVNRIAAPVRKAGRNYHGFNLFRAFDLELFVALARGEHTVTRHIDPCERRWGGRQKGGKGLPGVGSCDLLSA
jgi:hypothetical protein